jgi:hypothetical protein
MVGLLDALDIETAVLVGHCFRAVNEVGGLGVKEG